jgi:hypothetical protein
MLWATSRSVLPVLNNVSLPSNTVSDRLRGLAAEIEALGAETVLRALDIEIGCRAEAYLAGLQAYRRHPFRRPERLTTGSVAPGHDRAARLWRQW